MNRLRGSFRYALLTTLVTALALPAVAVKPTDSSGDCDDDFGTMTIDGTLAVMSESQLSTCTTKTELHGTLALRLTNINDKDVSTPEVCDGKLTIISTEVTLEDGQTSTASAVSGTLTLLDCSSSGDCKPSTSLDIVGTIGGDGTMLLIMENMKRVRSQSTISSSKMFVASGVGRITFKAKEGASLTARGRYIGHVTIVK